MKRLLLAAAAVAVLSIAANARDDRLPANFVGDWCFAEHTADHLALYLGSLAALFGSASRNDSRHDGWRANILLSIAVS